MKILHCCGGALKGGAWRACRRLDAALKKAGIESSILELPPPVQWTLFSEMQRKRIIRAVSGTRNPAPRTLGIFGGMGVVDALNRSDADMIHLHVPEGIIPIFNFSKIRKKTIWTLHDSWIFCGTEIHPDLLRNDMRWKEGYSRQNFPETSSRIDLDKWIWLLKKHCHLEKTDAIFTAPSRWEAEHFEESALFHGRKCRVIPNCLDEEIFHAYIKAVAREHFHLPQGKKILLAGAMDATAELKGFYYLKDCLKILAEMPEKDSFFLVLFGQVSNMALLKDLPLPHCCTGNIDSEEDMAQLYSAADVFIAPSLAEAFPYTCLESVFCGTPAAAFASGGIPDIVKESVSGALAEPFDALSLAQAVMRAMELKRAEKPFDMKRVAENYLSLYKSVLSS